MKKMIVTCVLLVSTIATAFSQHIELKGVVREAKTNEVLAFVNVVLQTPDSVFVTGTVSDDSGRFAIPNLKPGDYRLALSFMGYKTLYIEVAGLSRNLALPNILMEEEAVGLDAVTVTASASTSRIDRKLIFPTERQISASSNGLDLLQQLMLPRLQVNPVMHSISVLGGGEVQLRINGVKAGVNDIVALLPTDIIRVEFHDNPGLRYGNAEAVIDYIVRRHETGGNLGMGIMNSVQPKIFGNSYLNGRINHRKSDFSINYWFNQRDSRQMWRDNEETFSFADGSFFRRKETGEPGYFQSFMHEMSTAYSYLNENRMFNATIRFYTFDRPHYDYNGKLYNRDRPDDYVQMFDQTKNRTSRPAFDLYYQENLKNDRMLAINLVGTYHHADETRIYRESREGALLTDVNSLVTGNKYSWIGEGIYERKLGANSLSAGLRHTQAYSDNTYKSGHEYRTEMQQGETFFYGEWKGKVRKLDYTLGAGVTRSNFRQEGNGSDYDYYTFNPRLALFHPLPGQSSVRLTARISNNMPSLSSLSAVEQVIDSLQIQRGNPNLKPFLAYQSELNYEWRKGIFYAGVQGKYEYQPSAIMDEKFPEGNRIIQTWDNQQSWQYMAAILNLRVGPVKDILTLSFNGGLNHYVSHGNTYRHVYNNPFFNVTLNGNYRNFNAMFLWQNPWNRFYGETMSGGEKLHFLSLGYKYRKMNFGLGAWSPFSNDFRQDTENRSAYASYKRSMYINDLSKMFLFTFSYNFSFGRTFQSGQKKVNNADNDAGVMKAEK
ncbi:MAG: TonB-dependent receptor [Tannerella sp.]|jgi:hypothetical protein|nr:TonB-dependent receptor [Tannerella sp.]